MLGLVTGIGRAALSSPAAIAQSGCEGTDCTIDCTTSEHPWFGDPGSVEWLTVHAKPRLKSTSTPIIWYDPGTDTFPRLRVIGSYKSSGGADLSAEVTVEDDGICVETDPHDLIRCHDGVAGDADHLCDSWTGDNARVASGSGGGCVSEVIYGFDFRKSITIEGVEFCWISSALTPLPTNGLFGRTTCSGGNLVFDRGTDGSTFICQTVETPRPGGDKVTDKTVFWDYQP